jgi:UDP-3-O-[3-hydroxymyristoyl] N-acetylglucosamine deacetylase
MSENRQCTLAEAVGCTGVAIHTCQHVEMRIRPAAVGSGVVFQRMDLPGKPTVAARLEQVRPTARHTTTLAYGETQIVTVEHLLAALRGCGIDNAHVELWGEELPIFDGSARPFVELIESVGRKEQEAARPVFELKEPVYFSVGECHLIALPAPTFKVSYTLSYAHVPGIGSQYYSIQVTEDVFKREIAPCRTFAPYEEVVRLRKEGLVRNGSLENAIVVQDGKVLNPEGLRFDNEMARHKVLDLIGDLALLGYPLQAHIVALRSGHSSNVAFAQQLDSQLKKKAG